MPWPSASRLLSRSGCAFAGALACGLGLASCSAVLDWANYSGASSHPVEDGGDDADADAGDGGPAAHPEGGQATCASKCGGCCDPTGFCSAGQAAALCGAGGAPCQDCGAKGLSCRAGACVSEAPEAGPPPVCVATSCTQCIPVIQTGCCKTAQTCGCQYVPAPGTPQGCR